VPSIGFLDMRRMCFFHSQIQTGLKADSIGLEDAFVADGKNQPALGWSEVVRGLEGGSGMEIERLLSIGLRLSHYRRPLKPLGYALSVPKAIRTFDVVGFSWIS
jgi:hypothetical protein